MLTLLQTALELGLISALTVLALFLSYSMLNVCDLSTDGCFTLGATVGATVAISGHPYLSIPAAMLAGVLSGFVTAILQTKMGVNSLLAGIIVNTALYSVNIAVMGNSSLLNMNRTETVFTVLRDALKETAFADTYRLNNRSLHRKLVHRVVRLPAGTVAEIGKYRHRHRYGHCCAGIIADRLRIPRQEENTSPHRRYGPRRICFPPCVYRRSQVPYAGVYAEIRFIRDSCHRNLSPVPEKTAPACGTKAEKAFRKEPYQCLNSKA